MQRSPYLIVTGDFVRTGGMDQANFALALYLAEQGHAVHLVAHRVDPDLASHPQVTVHLVPKIARSDLLSSFQLGHTGRQWARHISQQGGRVIVNGGNCDWTDSNWVHYVHAAYPPGGQSHPVRKLKGAIAHQCFAQAERRILRSAQTVIANSERTKQDVIEKLQLPPERIHVIYCGTDPTRFYPATPTEKDELRHRLGWSTAQPVVLFIGGLSDRRKGFDTLFAAWKQLCTDPGWDVNLVVIGAGAERPLWEQRSREQGIGDRLHFLGFRSDVPDLLRAADGLVAPTRYEPYGLGVHEAVCCGLPAIVSATAGVAERYPENLQNLLLPDPENVWDLVQKLQQWRQEMTLYSELIRPFTQTLRRATWDDMTARIAALHD